MNLSQISTPSPLGINNYLAEVPDGWQQGRGAFGGLVVALLLRAIQQQEPGRPVRSFTAHLCGPVLVGAVDIQVEILRQGAGLSTVAARLLQDGAVCAHGVADLGKVRAPDLGWNEMLPPTMPDWRQMEPLPMNTGFAPTFTQHFLYRPVKGLPFSGKKAATSGWIQAREPGDLHDAAWLATLVDAWWLAAWVRLEGPRPAATIAFTLHGLADSSALNPNEPLFYRGFSELLSEGYTVEQRELWTEDGRLMAINHQTVAIIK